MPFIDPKSIARLKAAVDAAPPPPWRYDPTRGTSLTADDRSRLGDIVSEEAGAFVVAAREILPGLLRERDQLRDLVRRLSTGRNGTMLQCLVCTQVTQDNGQPLDHVPGCIIEEILR
jgi:hypothetical protein